MHETWHQEFEQQCANLLQKDYPAAAGLTAAAFLQHLEPLRAQLVGQGLPVVDLAKGRLPFVIVVKSDCIAAEDAMARVEREGKPGVTKLYPSTPTDFKCIERVGLPPGLAKRLSFPARAPRYVVFDPRYDDRAWYLAGDRWVLQRRFDEGLRREVRYLLAAPYVPVPPPIPLPAPRLALRVYLFD